MGIISNGRTINHFKYLEKMGSVCRRSLYAASGRTRFWHRLECLFAFRAGVLVFCNQRTFGVMVVSRKGRLFQSRGQRAVIDKNFSQQPLMGHPASLSIPESAVALVAGHGTEASLRCLSAHFQHGF
jgi:hypothetical protein